MAGTVVAVFSDKARAEHAAHALLDSGVTLNDISLVRKDAGGEVGAPSEEGDEPERNNEEYLSHEVREVSEHDVERPINTVEEIAPRATVGVVMGVPLGALLIASSIFIPGMGAILAAGPLLAMLTGGVAGGVLGGLVGAMTSGGIPEDAAKSYHAHIENGDTLVTVLAGSHNHEQLADILRSQGGRELGYFPRFIDTVQSVES